MCGGGEVLLTATSLEAEACPGGDGEVGREEVEEGGMAAEGGTGAEVGGLSCSVGLEATGT